MVIHQPAVGMEYASDIKLTSNSTERPNDEMVLSSMTNVQ